MKTEPRQSDAAEAAWDAAVEINSFRLLPTTREISLVVERAIHTVQSAPSAREKALVDALEEVKTGLKDPRWGTWPYMEGSDVYGDIERMISCADNALTAYRKSLPAEVETTPSLTRAV